MAEEYIAGESIMNNEPRGEAPGVVYEKHLGEQGQAAAATIGPSVVCVGPDLTDLNREDVSNTVEFASRVATNKTKENAAAWFTEYVDSISKLGWGKQATRHGELDLSRVTVGTTVAKLIKDVVQTDSEWDEKRKKLLDLALSSLVNKEDRRKLLNKFTSDKNDVALAVSIVTIQDGNLAMRTIGFHLQATEKIRDCLLFKISKKNIKISLDVTDFFANQPVLDDTRKKLEEKLGAARGGWRSLSHPEPKIMMEKEVSHLAGGGERNGSPSLGHLRLFSPPNTPPPSHVALSLQRKTTEYDRTEFPKEVAVNRDSGGREEPEGGMAHPGGPLADNTFIHV
ncbi:hypothetical protein BD779DRAFT_1782290 [Infundibulicybe gibba]|nr:hypothetical protein BD779DRAFT_1782290 [Infundibulicybe gibba]